MGLKDVLEVAWELHELLCDIPLEIEDPEERDAGAETFIKRSISPGQCRMLERWQTPLLS